MKHDLLALAKMIAGLPGLEFQRVDVLSGALRVGPEERAVLRAQVNEFLERSFEAFDVRSCRLRS